MDRVANSIRNRLSLRHPQEESLSILAKLVSQLDLTKNADLNVELEKVNNLYPTCIDFERQFPSLCFALATGVGKTRLMGAFVAYLYLEKGIKNFFVMAPNLTIYKKLIEDFSMPSNPKYVFQGIGEFAAHPPQVITGDNYNQHQSKLFEEVCINIFNISKINVETRGGNIPRIKRLSEYIGESYFNYLAGLDDLVLLMDESHHYRADRGMQVINELNPILGLELTATPKVERGQRTIKFRNVVYEYSLARAIVDGFVKEPAVATRKDFDPKDYSIDELDRIKMEDGIRIHEDTKVALVIYARDRNVEPTKPFVLVVAKDTGHAAQLKKMVTSKAFFEGYYADKVMEIHSSQRGAEKEENIELLTSVEAPDNRIEIVIHVNMLKEGWDVTNLYTIIPLRTAASMTLREQTIGRGLRLPYGMRTGVDKVDKMTIIAHDKFQEIIDEANKPDSIIKRENIIAIDPDEIFHKKEVVTSDSKIQEQFKNDQQKIDEISEPETKQAAQVNLEIKKAIVTTLPELNKSVTSVNELTRADIKKIGLEKLKKKIFSDPQMSLFAEQTLAEAEKAWNQMAGDFAENIIEIPQVIIQQSEEIKYGFREFNLNTAHLNFQPVSEEILIKKLREQEDGYDIVVGKGRIIIDSLENLIVNELMNYPEVDYDSQSALLFKLAQQAVEKFQTYLDSDKMANVVQFHKKEIGRLIYTQLMENFYFETPEYEKTIVRPFTKIQPHNFSKYARDSIHHYTDTITPVQAIPTKVFSGFQKACHNLYKFDSKTEKDFAYILEHDNDVLKWLRPAQNQFHIYWKHNSRQYTPDFVVETKNTIFMIETKKKDEMDTLDVQEKALAAATYCSRATKFTRQNNGKSWKYSLIPHHVVMPNMSFNTLAGEYEFKI